MGPMSWTLETDPALPKIAGAAWVGEERLGRRPEMTAEEKTTRPCHGNRETSSNDIVLGFEC